MNLAEEFPDKAGILEEDVIELWDFAQKESVPMNKFSVWVDAQLRGKFDLPQLIRHEQLTIPKLRLPQIQLDKINEARKRAAEALSVYSRKAVEGAQSLAERVRTPSAAPHVQPVVVPPPIVEEEIEGDGQDGARQAAEERVKREQELNDPPRKQGSELMLPARNTEWDSVVSSSDVEDDVGGTDAREMQGEVEAEVPPPANGAMCAGCVVM